MGAAPVPQTAEPPLIEECRYEYTHQNHCSGPADLSTPLRRHLCEGTSAQTQPEEQRLTGKQKSLNVLFVGNSYTARHNLANVVKQLAEAGDSELTFSPTQVIYGGRTLSDHWQLGSQHIVNRHAVTADQVRGTIANLEAEINANPKSKYAPSGLKRMRSLLQEVEAGTLDRGKWDVVILQSYRDDLNGDDSLYMQFAPRFVELVKAQGAQALLYETTPTTQNQFPIAKARDTAPVTEKSKSIARLAKKTGALVAPMAFVAQRCQTGDPRMTLRFENDAHLNQTMSYLTACTIYAALFDRSPEGLAVDSVTDIRFLDDDKKSGKDRDGKPITKTFTEKERTFLQSTAWNALQTFKKSF